MTKENIMDIHSVKNVTQLKKIGTLSEVVEYINEIMEPFSVPDNIDSFELLLPFLNKAKLVTNPEINYLSFYEMFASRRAQVLYCLIGPSISSTMDRLEFLNFPEKFHEEPEVHSKDINRWFNKLKLDIESQRRTDDLTHKATLKLDDIKKELEDLLGIEIVDTEDEVISNPILTQQTHSG